MYLYILFFLFFWVNSKTVLYVHKIFDSVNNKKEIARSVIGSSMKSPSPMINNNGDDGNDGDYVLLFDIFMKKEYSFSQFLEWINKLEYDTESLLYDFTVNDDYDDYDNNYYIEQSNIYKYFDEKNKLFLFNEIKKLICKYKS